MLSLLIGMISLVAFLLVLWLPAWWSAGRLGQHHTTGWLRALLASGMALVGYMSFVSVVGRYTEQSLLPATLWIALSTLASKHKLTTKASLIAAALMDTAALLRPSALHAVDLCAPCAFRYLTGFVCNFRLLGSVWPPKHLKIVAF